MRFKRLCDSFSFVQSNDSFIKYIITAIFVDFRWSSLRCSESVILIKKSTTSQLWHAQNVESYESKFESHELSWLSWAQMTHRLLIKHKRSESQFWFLYLESVLGPVMVRNSESSTESNKWLQKKSKASKLICFCFLATLWKIVYESNIVSVRCVCVSKRVGGWAGPVAVLVHTGAVKAVAAAV